MPLERVVPVSTSPTEKPSSPIPKHTIRNTTPKMKVYPVKESPPLVELRSIFA
jgi:hypothetical protein